MDVFSRGIQNAGIILMVSGCLLAVTITPLPYKDGQRRNDRLIQAKGERILETQPLNERQVHGTYQTKGSARVTIDEQPVSGVEPGFRVPKGSATFLDQEEGNRIRRQMMGERGSPGFWGGNENRRGYDDRRNYDNNYDGNRYLGNEIDRDPYYYEQKSRGDTVYYPNYNPEPSPSNRRDYECDPRSKSYHGYQGGRGGYDNNGNRGYNGRGGGYDEKGYGGYNGNRGRRYDDRNRNQPSSYDRNRGGDQWGGRVGNSGGNQWNDRNRGGDQWGGRGGGNQWNDRNVYDRDDNIGEGTVGFYGKVRRP